MERPRTSAFVGVSLDGFLARPDGAVDFLEPYGREDHGYEELLASVDTLVVGRRTYDFVLEMIQKDLPWPYPGKRCVVMTHRPVEGRHGERSFAGEPEALLGELGVAGSRHAYVDGGVVIRAFLGAGLLDALTVSFVPCLLGTGIPLFGGLRRESGFVLERATSFPDGVSQLRFRLENAGTGG
jgi:dihydrofolate reductase